MRPQAAAEGENILRADPKGLTAMPRGKTDVVLESVELEGYGPFKCAWSPFLRRPSLPFHFRPGPCNRAMGDVSSSEEASGEVRKAMPFRALCQ